MVLVLGAAAIVAVVFSGWDVVLERLGRNVEDPVLRWALIGRGLLAAALLALWSGGYVFWALRRLGLEREKVRRREAEAERAQRRAEAQLGLSALAGVLTHEVRTPLHGIALYAEKLRRLARREAEGLGGELIDLADRIDGQTRALDELLADYARHGAAQATPFRRSSVDLAALVADALRALEPRAEAHAARIDVELPAGLPHASGDAERLRQALFILLRNAIEAVAPGGRVVLRGGLDRGLLVLEVSHEARSGAEPSALFRPFTASDGTSGLGFAIVRDVMRAHGGEVGAAARADGPGTTVTLRLPQEAR